MTPGETAACAPGGCGGRHDGSHVWMRLVAGWHVGFWLVTALAAVWTAVTPGLATTRRAAALALLAVLAATYLAGVQRHALAPGRGATLYLAVAVAVTGAGTALTTTLTLLLFIVYAQAWMLVRPRHAGAVWSALLSATVVAGYLAGHGWTLHNLGEAAPQMLVSLVVSLLLGYWISRIIEQSAERADLIAQLERARADLALAERARERERLAREIHDTLAQGFTSIVLLAQAAAPLLERDPAKAGRQLALIEDVARENLAEARALVAAGAPAGLDGTTLPDAVRRLTERFGHETGVEVDVDLARATRLDRDREVVVLRAVQEALSNVRRHACAGRVAVRLASGGDGAVLEVGDDGVGFVPGARPGAGYGLSGMRARLAEVGGRLDVDSAPGSGTRLTIRLPVEAT